MGEYHRHDYSYDYEFSIDEAITPSLYEEAVIDGFKIFLFEIRTDFAVERTDGGGAEKTLISSEKFDACVPVDFEEHVPAEEPSEILYEFVHQRMKEYNMNWREIEDFAEAASRFARSYTVVDPRYRYLVPVVVHLEVRTVQQKGELLEDTMKRAVRAESSTPDRVDLSLPDNWPGPRGKSSEEALALVEVCPVCLQELIYEIHLKKRVCPVCGSLPPRVSSSSRWERRWMNCKSVVTRILSQRLHILSSSGTPKLPAVSQTN